MEVEADYGVMVALWMCASSNSASRSLVSGSACALNINNAAHVIKHSAHMKKSKTEKLENYLNWS
jgi:hypothetical protein